MVVNADGTFSYTPDRTEQFIATATEGDDTDTFTITVNDGHGATPSLTITVTVTPAAIASDGAAALAAAQSVIGSALRERATAQADMATLVTSLGSTLTGAQLDALMAMIMAGYSRNHFDGYTDRSRREDRDQGEARTKPH